MSDIINPILAKLDEVVNSHGGGAKIVGLTTYTEVKLLKKGRTSGDPCPYGEVHKHAERNVIIACRYESCVNRQRIREEKTPDFQAESLWRGKGRHVSGSACLVYHVDHPEDHYLAFKLSKNIGELYCTSEGQTVPVEFLADWLPKDQLKAPKQELDSPVEWRVIKIENIQAVRFAGEEVFKPLELPKTAPKPIEVVEVVK